MRRADLDGQVEQIADTAPDVAVIMIGANDVTHRVRPPTAVRHLDHAVRRLRELGAEVVVGTCPDLGTVEPVPQPLRWIARRASRQLAAAQTIAVVEAGGRTRLARRHPRAGVRRVADGDVRRRTASTRRSAGYASAAAVLLPSLCAALGLWFGADAGGRPDLARGEGVRPSRSRPPRPPTSAGTEVAGAQVGGRDRGPRGRWALLRRRDGTDVRPDGSRRLLAAAGVGRPAALALVVTGG